MARSRRALALAVMGAALILSQCVGAISQASAAENAAAAEKLNPYGRDITFTVPLREFGPLGQVEIKITKDQKILVLAKDFATALSRSVSESYLKKIKGLAGGEGFIPLSALASVGFPTTFNSSSVELVTHIPPQARTAQSVQVGPLGLNLGPQPDHSADLGAFLNYRVGETYQISGNTQQPTQFQGDFELGGRVAQLLAFDTYATYTQAARSPFSRIASRLFYDMPGDAIRITAGDLVPEGTSFQNGLNMAGLQISHVRSQFGTYFSSFTNAGSNLTLVRPAQVQLYVNNLPISVLHLGAGTYDLRNLPLVAGANNVKAVITDSTGQTRTVHFSYFSDIDLLAPGETEYSGAIGILSPLGASGPNYLTDQPALSGYYRRGITSSLTAGANLQATKDQQLLGLSAGFGTNWGMVSIDVAASNSSHGGTGEALRAEYRYIDQIISGGASRSITASAEYRSANFLAPVDSPTNLAQQIESRELVFAVDAQEPLTHSLSVELSGNYLKSRTRGGDSGSATAMLQWVSPYDATLGVGVSYEWAQRQPSALQALSRRGFTFVVSLTKSFGSYGSLTSSADRFEQRVDYTRPALSETNDYFLNGHFDHSGLGYLGNATAGYRTSKGDASVTYSTSLNPDGSVAGNQVGGFYSGSVDFADGRAGIGRNIYDGFAIIDTDKSLDGHKVRIVTPYDNKQIASTSWLGPAVIPLTAYQRQAIHYDVDNLPVGYDLGSGAFNLYPWYHAGYSLDVGSPYNVTVLGYLLDAAGKPLSLQTGMAVNLADPKAPKREVVSNGSGRFAALGVSPGTWRITMHNGLQYEIHIPESKGMLVNVGKLKPLPKATGGKR